MKFIVHCITLQTTNPSQSSTTATKTISTSSTSKAFALAGLRLGWIVTKDQDIIQKLYSKRDYNTISVSAIDDMLATVALSNYKHILARSYDICQTNLQILEKYIDSTSLLSWVKPKGGSTCFVKVNIDNIDTMDMCVELVEKYKTLIVPGEVLIIKRVLENWIWEQYPRHQARSSTVVGIF